MQQSTKCEHFARVLKFARTMSLTGSCDANSVDEDIGNIQTVGGYVYGAIYIGALLIIFIAASITHFKKNKQENSQHPPEVYSDSDVNHQQDTNPCKRLQHRVKEIGKEMMRLRNIYFVIVVHIFDTMTDFLISLEWFIKGQRERKCDSINYPNLNYLGCFLMAMIILLLYRLLSARYMFKYYQCTKTKATLYSIAQFLDISIFFEVYQSHIHSAQTDNLSYLSKLGSVCQTFVLCM